MALRQHIADTINQTYVAAGKDLHNNTIQLQRTHVTLQVLSLLGQQLCVLSYNMALCLGVK